MNKGNELHFNSLQTAVLKKHKSTQTHTVMTST